MAEVIKYTEDDKNEILAYCVEQMMVLGEINCPIPWEIKGAAQICKGKYCKPFFPEINACPCYTYALNYEFVIDTFWEGLK